MSKILFLTDTHIGVRQSSSIFREYFRQYFNEVLFPYIIDHNIETVIHAGDFFDNRTSLHIEDLSYVVNEFIPTLEKVGTTWYIIAGNHDVTYKNTNKVNSLALLLNSEYIHVVDSNIRIVPIDTKRNFVLCPWINRENEESLMDELALNANQNNILVGHFEFAGFKMYANSVVSDRGLDVKDPIISKYHQVLSGHFHHYSEHGNVRYLGALGHYTWSDVNDWRGFTVYDPGTDQYEQIENTYCLFTQLDYHADKIEDIGKDELKDLVEDQYVRIIINEPVKHVDLKATIHKIESFNPISVDVIDNTIVKSKVDTTLEFATDDRMKGLDDYVIDTIQADSNLTETKQTILVDLFKEIYDVALEQRKETTV